MIELTACSPAPRRDRDREELRALAAAHRRRPGAAGGPWCATARASPLRAAVARRPRRRLGDLLGERQRHGLPRPRRLAAAPSPSWRARSIEERLVLGGPPRPASATAPARRSTSTRRTSTGITRQRHAAPSRSTPTRRRCGGSAVRGRRRRTLRAASVSYAEELRPAEAPGWRGRRDLLVVGGGVMGLFTAYHAAERGARVSVLERGRIGDPATASYGRTRSFRTDYLDADLRAARARGLPALGGLRAARPAPTALVRCGCMNIAKRSVTPDLGGTYAQLSREMLDAPGTADGVLRRRGAAPALPLPRRRRRPSRGRRGRRRRGRGRPGARARARRARRGTLEGAHPTRDRARRRRRFRVRHRRRRVRHARARGHRRPRHQRRPVAAPGCRLQVPITRDRPTRGQVPRPARGRPRTGSRRTRCR